MSEINEPEPGTERALSDEEKRIIRLYSQATYEALKRLDDEKETRNISAEAQSTHETYTPEEPTPRPDAVVEYNYRLHWVKLLGSLPIANLVVVAIIAYTLLWFIQAYARDHIGETVLANFSGFVQYIFPLAPTILVALAAIDIIRERWHDGLHDFILWFSERWVIDSYEIRHIVEVKGVFFNMIGDIEDRVEKIPRSAIIDPSVSQSWIGELLGFAELSLGSASEQDTRFKGIRYLRHPKKMKQILGLDRGE